MRVQPTHQHEQHERADWRDWRDEAACRDADPELFFPTASTGTPAYARQVAEAKAVCHGCAVAPECLDEAMTPADDYGLSDGVAGGLDEHERREAWAQGQVMRAALERARAAVDIAAEARAAGGVEQAPEDDEARRRELARWHGDDQAHDEAAELAAVSGDGEGFADGA